MTQLTPVFLKQVQAKGQVVFEQLEDLIAPLPIVKNVTGMGLMIGIHLTADVKVADVIAELQKQGMLALPAEHNTLRLLPPLVMSEADLVSGIQLIQHVLQDVAVAANGAVK